MLAKWKRDKKSIGKVRGGECQPSLSSGLVFKFLFFSSFDALWWLSEWARSCSLFFFPFLRRGVLSLQNKRSSSTEDVCIENLYCTCASWQQPQHRRTRPHIYAAYTVCAFTDHHQWSIRLPVWTMNAVKLQNQWLRIMSLGILCPSSFLLCFNDTWLFIVSSDKVVAWKFFLSLISFFSLSFKPHLMVFKYNLNTFWIWINVSVEDDDIYCVV